MAHEDCAFCKEPGKWSLKVEQNCRAIEKVVEEQHGLEGVTNDLKTEVALLKQKIDNFKYPVWIIAAAALTQLAKILFSFAPAVKSVAATLGG